MALEEVLDGGNELAKAGVVTGVAGAYLLHLSNVRAAEQRKEMVQIVGTKDLSTHN